MHPIEQKIRHPERFSCTSGTFARGRNEGRPGRNLQNCLFAVAGYCHVGMIHSSIRLKISAAILCSLYYELRRKRKRKPPFIGVAGGGEFRKRGRGLSFAAELQPVWPSPFCRTFAP